jgi:hypothetical protein
MKPKDSLTTFENQQITDSREPCITAALRYAKERGWLVFPAPPGEKKSYKSAQYSDGSPWGATNDLNQIRRDFTRWTRAGIGIPTGPENGFWVIECDTPEGHDVDGLAALQALEAEHGTLPPTLMAVSPSGSVHRYFKWPNDGSPPIINSTSKIATGIDIKGAGGMVLAPPTLRPNKGAYKWLNDLPIAEAPEWLLALVPKKSDSDEVYQGEAEADIELVAAAVARLPNPDHDWETWNKAGMAIYAATGGSEEGFKIFDAFSQKSTKYNAGATREKWGKFHSCPPNAIGADFLFAQAEEADPDFDPYALPDLTGGQLPRTESPSTVPDSSPEPKVEQKPKAAKRTIPEFNTDWCDVTKVPRRRWLYGQHYIRKAVSATIAAGGKGKTTLAIAEAICIATGKPLLGVPVIEQCKAWFWSGEEPRDELQRRVHAVCAFYGLNPYEIAKTFHFTSGVDEFPIKIATVGKRGITVDEALLTEIVAYIRKNDIGVMIVDPLISCHGVPENDNVAIDIVAKAWGRVAAGGDCSVDLDHHTRKPGRADDGDAMAEDARGAVALINAVRCSRVINAMSEKEAGQFNAIREEYFRVNRAKVNMVKGGNTKWYQLVSVEIGNSTDIDFLGDSVQTIIAWTPPEASEGVTTEHMSAVRAKLAVGEYKRNWQSREAWVGTVIAHVIGLDPESDRGRIEQIIKDWLKLRVLKVEPRWSTKHQRDVPYVVPGEWTE